MLVSMPGQSAQGTIPAYRPANALMSNAGAALAGELWSISEITALLVASAGAASTAGGAAASRLQPAMDRVANAMAMARVLVAAHFVFHPVSGTITRALDGILGVFGHYYFAG